jgi:hypothetical protein
MEELEHDSESELKKGLERKRRHLVAGTNSSSRVVLQLLLVAEGYLTGLICSTVVKSVRAWIMQR